MGRVKSLWVVGQCAVLLAGCANSPSQQQQAGMVSGGMLGGAPGSQVGPGDGNWQARH